MVVSKKKNILFLTGTRADFGKLKSLMNTVKASDNYELSVFATGMHLNAKYGKTVDEITKAGFDNVFQFINHDTVEHMDRTLAKTVDGFSHYVNELRPDLIVVHGDRVEALAGAIVGSMNNILVAHVEGGEISGTIDELIRHAVSKMSHVHFVANEDAKKRLIQLGEFKDSIFEIGSPDIDLMNPAGLPDINDVKAYYSIPFENYAIAMFHPVTTEYKDIRFSAKSFVDALIKSGENYVVIYPNNDLGSAEILAEYERIKNLGQFKIFPSVRFESFLSLLKNAKFMIGNSSAGIREAPYYGVPTIDIGTRQMNRAQIQSIVRVEYDSNSILRAIKQLNANQDKQIAGFEEYSFGEGNSEQLFMEILESGKIWEIACQKQLQEI